MHRTNAAIASLCLTFLCLAALPAAPALAAEINPDGSAAPVQEPEQGKDQAAQAGQARQEAPNPAHPSIPDPAAAIKKAMEAQGDISPHTARALERDPKAMEAIGRGGQGKGQPSGAAGGTAGGTAGVATRGGGKAIYGDIIIHK